MRLCASDIHARLSARYAPPEWVYLREARNGTGYARQVRYVDALAMSCFPSRGLRIIGHEIKVDRGDWLRELKNPKKADEIASYCDEWFVVVSDPAIVQDGELPATWGLLAPSGPRLRCVQKPRQQLEPLDPSRSFLASILRSVTRGYVARSAIKGEIEKARRAGREEQRQSHASAEREHAALQCFVQKLHDEAGIDVRSPYSREGTLSALKVVQRHRYTDWESVLPLIPVAERLATIRTCAEALIAEIDSVRAEAEPAPAAGGGA